VELEEDVVTYHAAQYFADTNQDSIAFDVLSLYAGRFGASPPTSQLTGVSIFDASEDPINFENAEPAQRARQNFDLLVKTIKKIVASDQDRKKAEICVWLDANKNIPQPFTGEKLGDFIDKVTMGRLRKAAESSQTSVGSGGGAAPTGSTKLHPLMSPQHIRC
jgi:hypothetical protein